VSVPPRVIDIISVPDGVAYLQKILNNHLRLCDAVEEVNAYRRPLSLALSSTRRQGWILTPMSCLLSLYRSSGKGLVGRDELAALQDFVISVSARDPDVLTRSRMRVQHSLKVQVIICVRTSCVPTCRGRRTASMLPQPQIPGPERHARRYPGEYEGTAPTLLEWTHSVCVLLCFFHSKFA
jgi:hypothetical protein